MLKTSIYILSTLFLGGLQPFLYAQQTIGDSNICGTQIIGNGSVVICNVNTWPLNSEKKSKLEEFCREEDFGADNKPPVIFITKKTYNVGQIISIRYSGACPNKTEFLVLPANAPPKLERTVGERRKSLLVPSYEGEIRFIDNKLSKAGTYVVQSYFLDSHRNPFRGKLGETLGERSLPFEVRPRY